MRVCLSMIVKNESKIITRLLSSVVGFVDEYCICDTGSTDDTIEVIQSFDKLKGRVYSDPFVNFEVSRTGALREAQKSGADYILLLDADMIFQFDPRFDKTKLVLPLYTVFQESGNGLKYTNARLVRGDAAGCRYVGVTHEYLDNAGLPIGEISDGILIRDVGDGGSKADKFVRDIRLLEQGILDEPNNVRYRFYLANSYFDTQQFETAIGHYLKRVEQGEWAEEVYFSLFRIALCYRDLNKEEEFLNAAIKAWRYRPRRAESIFEAMQYFHNKRDHKMVVLLYHFIKDLKTPDDKLFVSTHVYTHQMHFVHSLSAFFAGLTACPNYDKLFNSPHLDLNNQFNNYRFYYPVPSCTTVNFCASHVLEGDKYVASSPSILAMADGNYHLNIRLVNYHINERGGYDLYGTTIKSKNKSLILNRGLEAVGKPSFPSTSSEERALQGSDFKYNGIEDVKLARIGGKTYFTGTVCLPSKQIGTCIGLYDDHQLVPQELVPMQACEKNWVFLPNQLSMVYQWHPLRFGPLVGNQLMVNEIRATPKLFSRAAPRTGSSSTGSGGSSSISSTTTPTRPVSTRTP